MQSAVSSEAKQIGKTDCLFSHSGCTINENRRMENARDDMSDSQVQMSTVLREEKRHQGMLRILFRGCGKNLDCVVGKTASKPQSLIRSINGKKCMDEFDRVLEATLKMVGTVM